MSKKTKDKMTSGYLQIHNVEQISKFICQFSLIEIRN